MWIRPSNIRSNHYGPSSDGTILAMPNESEASAVTAIQVYYLDLGRKPRLTDREKICGCWVFLKTISFTAPRIKAGFSTTVTVPRLCPWIRIYIADRDLNVIREYSGHGSSIMDVRFTDTAIELDMASASQKNGKTVYTPVEGDYLAYNKKEDEKEVSLVTQFDNTFRNELYIKLPVSGLDVP